MSERKKTIFDKDSDALTDDLPKYIITKHGEQSDRDQEDTDENMDLVGGERLEPDIHTLVRSKDRKNIERGNRLRESLVGMKEGVPGIYSGYEQTEKRYSRLNPKGVDSSSKETEPPTRPPRKARGKSDSSLGGDDNNYDHLWTPRKEKKDEDDHVYSLLGSNNAEKLYDDVEEDSSREIVLNSSPMIEEEWIEDGRRFDTPGKRRNRPMSTVVLPISPVGDEQESDNESDWGSDFDQSLPNDQEENDDEFYEIIGDMSKRRTPNRNSVYEDLNEMRAKTAQALKTPPSIAKKPLPPVPDKPLPPIPDESSSLHDTDEDTVPYVDIIYDGGTLQYPTLPPMDQFASEDEIKRYQIIKYILENEKMYMTTLNNLIQDYEKPLKSNRIISQDSVKIIFQHLQEIEQCHKLFNIALVGRMADWNLNPNIGDIIYASFSKSMVLKAYTSYVRNFTSAMDQVKETCKSVPAFLIFLRNRLRKSFHKYSFYDLLKRPLGRFPQLVVLLQELLKVTPICHSDRLPLQMALTHMECLSELICDKRRDMEMKYKVSELDKYFTGLNKPLSSNIRYYIRHDDMLLCKVVDGRVVKTKHRRLFLLSDLLICASIINKQNAANMLTRKRYRVKWCVPVLEVDVVDVGSGISVNIDNKTTTTIRYTHPVSSPRPGVVNVEERLEDYQHDLAVIGQIAGLVASLRQSYDVINETKVSEWYRSVQETFDREIETANMHWLELSIPAIDKKTTTCLFNLHPPQKKIEWSAELENAKLRLAFENNPGWFILEDESANIGNMGILRRNLPLLANKVPLIMVESKFTIERILEVTPYGSSKPVLWIFSGTDHCGQITLMEMSMSSVPHVIESFSACEARILAAEVVKDGANNFADPSEQKILIWCGTMSGRIQIFNASSENDHEEIASTKMRDSVLCFKHVNGFVFAGIANGTVACFRRKTDNAWDLNNPVYISLSKSAIMDLAEARGRLWCASGNFIHVLDVETLGTERRIQVGSNSRLAVKHLVSYGSGVWASQWKSPKLHLYHTETFECLQSLSVVTPLIRMKNDIDTRIQGINIEKTYVTALLARGGLLWVGTDNGIIVTYPLPRLGGVPQVSGKPCVSFHGHEGAVRCLYAFRVERIIKHRMRNISDGDAIARSLFYVDPFDQAASGLDVPSVFPELATPELAESPDESSGRSEPFYYSLEPEEGSNIRKQAEYETWLKSFGETVKKVDPLFSPTTFELQSQQEGYNSDESIDSDAEFSFIEDRGKKIPQKAKKNAPSFSVDIPAADADGTGKGTVKANNLPGGMTPIAETDFAELMGNFEGFNVDTDESDKRDWNDSESLATETGFVVLGKTSSGYEEPIPAPDKILTVPYATVNKNRQGPGNGTLKGSAPKLIELDVGESFDDQNVGAVNPSLELLDKYKGEPLPDLPTKTLYETSKEWDKSLEEKYENYKRTVPDLDAPTQSESNDDDPLEHKTDGVDNNVEELEAQNTMEEIEANYQPSQPVEDAKDSEKSETEANQEELTVKTSKEKNAEKATVSDGDASVVEKESVEVDADEAKTWPTSTGEASSPVFIKVTNPETQASIEGEIEVGHHSGIEKRARYKSFSGRTETDVNVARNRSETMPVSSNANESLPWSSKTRHERKEDESTARMDSKSQKENAPGNLDLSSAMKIEHGDSVYTPLLAQTRESNASSLSGVGASSFDNDMALSTSLAREKVTKQSQQGMYASLISVSNQDNRSRIELLMRPMYVVSIGSGYVDLRRKQKLGSGLEFFMKLKATEPSPKLLIWKLTS